MNTVKSLLCAVLFAGIGWSAHAQFVNLGAHAGLNYPNMRIQSATYSQYKSYGGAMVGVWGRFGGLFYVQPEVNYTWSKNAVANNTTQQQSDLNIHSLQLVASPGLRPVRKKLFNLRLGGTASYSFLMAVDDNQLGIRKSDFRSGAINVGPFIGIDIWRITLDGRYLWSVRNQSGTSGEKWRNDMLQVALGFRLFGKK